MNRPDTLCALPLGDQRPGLEGVSCAARTDHLAPGLTRVRRPSTAENPLPDSDRPAARGLKRRSIDGTPIGAIAADCLVRGAGAVGEACADPLLPATEATIASVGELDPGRRSRPPRADPFASPGAACADYRGAALVPGAGHAIQQAALALVNKALAVLGAER